MEQDLRASLTQLQAEGWSVSEEAVAGLLQESEQEEDGKIVKLRQLLLDTDLKKTAVRVLPSDINSVDAQPLKGPHVLQVTAVEDISRPAKGGTAGGGNKHRILQLKLTDGKTTCKALEFRSAPTLDIPHLAPGTKVRVVNASIKLGIVLVDGKSIQVLGGRVDALAEPWEFQRKYGAAVRGPDAQDASEAQPPPFTPFVPGKSRAPHPSTLADIYKATAADQAAAAASAEAGTAGSSEQAGSAQRNQPGEGAAAHPTRRTAPDSQSQEAAVLQQAREAGAAKQRLLAKLAEDESSATGRGGRRGAGRGRGRRRRGGFDDEDDDSAMTLEEFEAQRKAKLKPMGGADHVQQQSDEELARQLQAQLDLEDGPLPPGLHFANAGADARSSAQPSRSPDLGHQAEQTAAEALRNSLFTFDRAGEDDQGGRFEGRGRGRGRRGRGRSRGRRGHR